MAKETKTENKPEVKTIAGLDINKLLDKARSAYAKNEKGLASQLATGTTIPRPSKDEDFVVWTKNNFWLSLTGMRGLPYGRIVQVAGKADSGKSSMAASFMKLGQDQGALVILWDSEKKFDSRRFDDKIMGSSENLLVVNTSNIIQGINAVANLVNAAKEQNPDVKILLVWDSVGASVNSTEDNDDGENYSKQPGVTAKEVAYAVRKLNKLSNKHQNKETGQDSIASLIINQTYSSIGIGPSVQIEKGGTELTYLSSLILQLSRKKDLIKVKGGTKYKYGIVSRAKVRKNHLFSSEDCVSELDIVVNAEGISLEKEIKASGEQIEGWDGDEEFGAED